MKPTRLLAILFCLSASLTLIPQKAACVEAKTLAKAKSGTTLHLILEGPYVICAETEAGSPVLRILVPKVVEIGDVGNDANAQHNPPGFTASFNELEMSTWGDYWLRIVYDNSTGTSFSQDPKAHLDSKAGLSCKKDGYFLSMTVPMPNKIWVFAPARAEFNAKCDESDAILPDAYGTKIDLEYSQADLTKLLVCNDSACLKKSDPYPWKPEIKDMDGTGFLFFDMHPLGEDPNGSPHHHARIAHGKMMELAGYTNHCVHFTPPPIRWHAHSDCLAPMLLVCTSGNNSLCASK